MSKGFSPGEFANEMTEEDPIPIPTPAYEGDFVLNEVLSLESGEILVNPTLHYAVYGQLNAARDNAVLVCHALSGSAQVGAWWPQLFLPGDLGLLDLTRDCVIGINIFGSCYGSTGPGSIDPATGKPYGPTFPLINVRDIVNAQVKLMDHLGIPQLKLAIGASIGGMTVLEWAILFPDRVARAIAIGVAPLGAMASASTTSSARPSCSIPHGKAATTHPERSPRAASRSPAPWHDQLQVSSPL